MDEIIKQIEKLDVGKVMVDVPISKYTTYRVGGIARALVFPKNIESLIQLLQLLKGKEILFKVIGNGSNLLFSDADYEGVLIKLSSLDEVRFDDTKVTVGAGFSLMKLAMIAARKGLAGLEFASGIPGTVGGAIFMNAGAYKSDMGYVVQSVKVLTPTFEVIQLMNRELDFHYRTSFLQKHPDYICLEATLKLAKGDKSAIEQVNRDRKARRLESQPLEFASAGSVFRNPEGKFIGQMIEQLGLKGLCKGGAQVSVKHANFVVNLGDASAQDIKDIIEFVKEAVKENYGVELKVEQEFVNWE